MKKLLSLVLALALALSLVAVAGAEGAQDLPRKETVYFGGQQWGSIVGWNPLSPDMNNAMASSANSRGSRTIMFETLYMYNMLDGGLYPLLADGDYVWNDDLTECTVKLNAAAYWSDFTPVTAADVVATWDACKALGNSTYTNFGPYIAAIEAVDDYTVVFKCVDDENYNPLQVLQFLTGVYVCQKAWIDAIFEKDGGDASAILADPAEDVPFSGP